MYRNSSFSAYGVLVGDFCHWPSFFLGSPRLTVNDVSLLCLLYSLLGSLGNQQSGRAYKWTIFYGLVLGQSHGGGFS